MKDLSSGPSLSDAFVVPVRIQEVLQRFLPELYRPSHHDYSVMCPFHDDTKASMRVHVQKNYVRCFGLCADYWGVVALVSKAQGVPLFEAVDLINKEFGDQDAVDQIQRARDLNQMRFEVERAKTELFPVVKGDSAYDYLMGRAIKPELIMDPNLVMKSSQGWPAFPHRMKDLIHLTMIRSLTDKRFIRVNEILSDCPYGVHGENPGFYFLCESEIDALSLKSVNLPACSVAIAAQPDTYVNLLPDVHRWFIMFDGDSSGLRASGTWEAELYPRATVVPMPLGEDVNSLLIRGELVDYLWSNTSSQ